jgi:hypothetical protein
MTEYVVFRKGSEDELWAESARYQARSSASAIRQHLEGAPSVDGKASGREAGVFVAVPARSWKPVTVKVETKTQLKFS